MSSAREITTNPMYYSHGNTEFHGHLALPADLTTPRPAVLVVHEWWGRTAFTDERAQALAELGYVGLSIDLYGHHQQADTPAEAGALSSALTQDFPELKARFMAAYQALQAQPMVDAQKIAAIGYCFGGSVALSMARQGVPLAGVVGFHAGVANLAPISGQLKTPIALFTGGNDPFVPNEAVAAAVDEMRAAGGTVAVTTYPAARHAFTNPQATAKGAQFGLPLVYSPDAATDSWGKAAAFLQQCFAGRLT
ncbi:dienelactone hydrolase family protein [Halothiobacillus sp. DCM-1]|uniref:dienelactone hydrolase family protein n=1 Tax=Halothiobacillus sp. DCM-1 TaxID=3112558 RepID=UPI003247E8C0